MMVPAVRAIFLELIANHLRSYSDTERSEFLQDLEACLIKPRVRRRTDGGCGFIVERCGVQGPVLPDWDYAVRYAVQWQKNCIGFRANESGTNETH